METQKLVKQQSAKIYYLFFNPFPAKINVFQEISLNQEKFDQVQKNLCKIELDILDIVQDKGKLQIEELISLSFETHHGKYAKSDIIPYVLDLMEEKILV